ncbi:MAG: peroxidase family protein [Myxococcota bacterium]
MPCVLLLCGASACAQPVESEPTDEERAALASFVGSPFTFFRTIDGTNNHPTNPAYGAANTSLLRLSPAGYGDGRSTPAGASRPSARAVSNGVVAQPGPLPAREGFSDYLWAWGQFLDHDLDLSEAEEPPEPFDIAVPLGDPFFDPGATGMVTIPLDRTVHDTDANGVRQQRNEITAFIDASNVYGSNAARADALRTLDGSGELRVSPGDLLPFNTEGLPNATSDGGDPADFFLAGDVRANEVVSLAILHTLFVREHNRLARLIAAEIPEAGGDFIYEYARMIVGAEMQAITYREFLPVLLGATLPPYAGYDDRIDPGIANEFSTAAYRLGHSMLSPELPRLDSMGNAISAGPLSLRNAFFAPDVLVQDGLEPMLRGLASQRAQNIDPFIVDGLRNFLFGPPGAGGFDLASLNIQRGRDHGLASYNATRQALGLPGVTDFNDISSDPLVRSRLSATYAGVDEIDLWVGGLSEDHLPGAVVGETFHGILTDQFVRLRAGDSFWYEWTLPRPLIEYIESRTLATIIRDNTDVGSELSEDLFTAPADCIDNTFLAAGLPIAIPDNGPAVESEISVMGAGVVGSLVISLDIQHTYRGDLVVSLVAPSGSEVVLSDREGGSAEDLVLRDVALSEFDGSVAEGTWILRVADRAGADVGTIDSWSLRIVAACGVCEFGAEFTTATPIPDNDATGIAVPLAIGAGTVRGVEVSLAIGHSWRGDLQVELESPSGTVWALHDRAGGSADDLRLMNVPSTTFDGESAAGDWVLRVSDNAPADTGVLESWSLRVDTCA